MGDLSLKQITKLKIGDIVFTTDSYGNLDKTEVITIIHYGESQSNNSY
jgi:hypothetical protein